MSTHRQPKRPRPSRVFVTILQQTIFWPIAKQLEKLYPKLMKCHQTGYPILVMDEDIYNEYFLNLNIDRADNNELNAEEFDGQWNYYLDLQRLYLSKEEVEFRTGFCLTVQGTWKNANWRNYVAMCKTFVRCIVHICMYECLAIAGVHRGACVWHVFIMFYMQDASAMWWQSQEEHCDGRRACTPR